MGEGRDEGGSDMETARLYVYRLTAASRNTSLFPEGGRLAKVYHS